MNFQNNFEDDVGFRYREKGWRNYELDWLKNWIDNELYKRSKKSRRREEFK